MGRGYLHLEWAFWVIFNPVKLVMKVDPHRKEAGEEKRAGSVCGGRGSGGQSGLTMKVAIKWRSEEAKEWVSRKRIEQTEGKAGTEGLGRWWR